MKVFLVAETRSTPGMDAYLNHIDPDEKFERTGFSDSEDLAEIMGRLCYRSFSPGLNPNVTRTRKGNGPYLRNILRVDHGSVLEHAQVSFIFADVTRVFTHELVRHRVGTAISQESLRFVRLEEVKGWKPSCIERNIEAEGIFDEVFKYLSGVQKRLAEVYDLDNPEMDFRMKKEVSSAMRRMAPIGLETTIGWSANFRTLRHVILNRTDPSAEEEIRVVFDEVAQQVSLAYPAIFQDMMRTEDGQWKIR